MKSLNKNKLPRSSKSKTPLNFIAPLTVSIVVVTLGAAFGVLSGRGAFVGMASTSIIAIVTAIFCGSRFGVSSPTGPMTAAIAVILLLDKEWLATHNSSLSLDQLANLTLILGALILLLLNLFKVHRLVKFIPNLVVSGFVNGIALLIIISQLSALNTTADAILMLFTFGAAFAVGRFNQNADHIVFKLLTNSFAVIVLMSIIAIPLANQLSFIALNDGLANIKLQFPPLSTLDLPTLLIVLPLALELALIALLDTLLTALIMDKKSGARTRLGREMTGQSVSMFGVSLIGGIPGAQSTVPSMILWQEKGHHPASKTILALFCVAFTLLFSNLLQFVPLAVFGGIILNIAVSIADFTSVKTVLHDHHKTNVLRIIIILGTCLVTVFVSLNLAVVAFTLLFLALNKFTPATFKLPDLVPAESEGLVDEV